MRLGLGDAGLSCLEVDLVGVRYAIVPAAKEDPDPFEGHRPDSGVVALAFFALEIVMLASPLAGADRAAGPFVKGLSNELRAGPAPVNPYLVATGLSDGSDAGFQANRLPRIP